MSFLRIQDHLIDVNSISFVELYGEEKRNIIVYFKTEYDENTRPDTDLLKNAKSYHYADAKTAQEEFERISRLLNVDRDYIMYHIVEEHTGKCVENQANKIRKHYPVLDKVFEESDTQFQDVLKETKKWLQERKEKVTANTAEKEEAETPRVHERDATMPQPNEVEKPQPNENDDRLSVNL